MANKTIALTSELYSGTVGMKLYLLNPTSGAVGNNAAGDTLIEGSNGLFTTVVDEAITGWWRVLVTDASDGPLIEGGWVYIPSDTVATYVVDDPSLMSTISTNVTTLLGRITADVYTMFTNLIAMITGTGANASFTAKAMENTASSVYVLPTKGTQQDRRAATDEIRIYKTEGYTLVRTVEDDAKALVDLSGKALELVIEGENRNDKAVIPDANISVSGAGNATYTVDIPTTVSAKSGKTYSFWLWDKTNAQRPKMLDNGKFIIDYAGTTGST